MSSYEYAMSLLWFSNDIHINCMREVVLPLVIVTVVWLNTYYLARSHFVFAKTLHFATDIKSNPIFVYLKDDRMHLGQKEQ